MLSKFSESSGGSYLEWAVEVVNSPESPRLLEGLGYLSETSMRNIRSYLSAYKTKELQLYMLANQLPLLQLGPEEPEISGQIDQYCQAEGAHYDQRLLQKLRIVAFSDPNDLFSYAIKPQYADQHMDSRLYPEITNVLLNVAKVINVLGIGELANPMKTHNGYHADERVILNSAVGGRTTLRHARSAGCSVRTDYSPIG